MVRVRVIFSVRFRVRPAGELLRQRPLTNPI